MDFKKLLRTFLFVLICSLSIQLYFITNGSFGNLKYIDNWTNLIGLNALSILGFGHAFIYTMMIVYMNKEYSRTFGYYINIIFVVVAIASIAYLYFGQDNGFMIFATVAVNASLVIICYYLLGNFIDLDAMVMVAKFQDIAKSENLDLEKVRLLPKDEISKTMDIANQNIQNTLADNKSKMSKYDIKDKSMEEFVRLMKKKTKEQ